MLTTYRFAVPILVVPCDVTKHVHHVLRAVAGLVSIKGLAACHVLHPVFASLATGAALKSFPVGTNVLAFAVKHVLKTTVTHVGPKMRPE